MCVCVCVCVSMQAYSLYSMCCDVQGEMQYLKVPCVLTVTITLSSHSYEYISTLFVSCTCMGMYCKCHESGHSVGGVQLPGCKIIRLFHILWPTVCAIETPNQLTCPSLT